MICSTSSNYCLLMQIWFYCNWCANSPCPIGILVIQWLWVCFSFVFRVKAISLVTLITPIKLNTISVQHVEFMHSIDLAVILRLMAFHCIVWMEELYKKLIQSLSMPLTGKIGKSTWWNIQMPQTTPTMCSSTKSQGLGAIKGNSGWKYTTMALADYWL